jgi:hypothetical protein
MDFLRYGSDVQLTRATMTPAEQSLQEQFTTTNIMFGLAK